MSKYTGHKLYRTFNRDFTRRTNEEGKEIVLPSQAKPNLPGFKARVEALARKKIEAAGGRFLSINFKKKKLHYFDEKGTRRSTGLVLDEKDKKKYER